MQASWVSFSSVLSVTSTDLSFVNRLADNALGFFGARWGDKNTFDTTEVDLFQSSLFFRAFTASWTLSSDTRRYLLLELLW